jgi:flagellar motor component MotA
MYLIGIAVFIFTFTMTFTFKGVAPGILINPAVVLTLLFVIIATLLATSNFKLFTRGFNAVISRKYYLPDEERRRAEELFHLLSRVTVASAVFLVFVGIISMLGHVDDTEALGHALTAALVSPIIASALIVIFFEPAAFILRYRQNAPERKMNSYPKALGDKLLELCYKNGLSEEDIENATDIVLRSDPRDIE